ncbi:MAG: TonB-dependent receptor [Weeksellaceae bacterium]
MNIKSILTFWVLCLIGTGYAQYNLSGNIKDNSTSFPLPDASVYLTDLKQITYSDSDGNYQFPNLKKGFYLIEVRADGYKSIIKSIEIQEDLSLDFNMEQAVTELNQIIITGVSHSTELKRSPVIIKTMDKTTFHQNTSSNLIDALQTVPGISSIGTGPAISKPVIRGLGYNRVITLNNGMRQEGQQWGDEHGIEIDEFSVDRVEIIKGPGSLMYGSDGIAGVLNFLAPKAPAEGTTETRLISNYQSNNNLIGYSVSNAGKLNGFQWEGRFSNKFAGNYENKFDGKVYNSGFKEYNGSLTQGINKNWGHSLLTISSYNAKLGIVEGERDELGNFTYVNAEDETVTATKEELKDYKIGIPYQWVNHLSVASNNYFRLNKGTLHADLGFQRNSRREFEEADAPDEAALHLSLNTLNYNFRYNFGKHQGWETSVGIGGMYQNNKNKGLEFLIPDNNLFDIGGFIYTQKTFGDFVLAGGLRFDNRSLHSRELYLDENENPTSPNHEDAEQLFAALDRNFNSFSGSIGVSYQVSENSTLKLNFSRGFRAPNIAELAANGKHEGTFRYEIGNPNLKSEINHQIDFAYYLDSEHITLEFTPFVNFINHYSFLEKLKDENGNDVIIDPDDPAPAFQYTSGNAMLLGGEFFLDIHPHPLDWLHIENSFAFVQATQNGQSDSTKYLPFTPAPRYRGGVKAEFSNLNKNISNFYVRLNVDHYFAQSRIYKAYQTETETPGYTLLSAGVGANFNAFGRKDFISLYLSGENLGNIAYQNHLSRLKYADENPLTGRTGVFNMGRNISLKMVLSF